MAIFTTGLGATDPPVETGAATLSSTTVLNPVTVTIGDVEVPVVYQGLTPTLVGLYQVNVVLTTSVTPGDAVPIVIRQNGILSNPNLPVSIPIR